MTNVLRFSPKPLDQVKNGCFELLKRAYIDARYKMDEYTITKSELEYLADKMNRLKELTDRICREQIQSIGLETSP